MMMQPPMGAPPMQMMPPGGMAGPMTPMQQGIGYDQYMPQVMKRRRQPAMYRMPAPPPRFPTPGRMDGTRDYPTKGQSRMPLMGLGGM